VTFEVFDEVI